MEGKEVLTIVTITEFDVSIAGCLGLSIAGISLCDMGEKGDIYLFVGVAPTESPSKRSEKKGIILNQIVSCRFVSSVKAKSRAEYDQPALTVVSSTVDSGERASAVGGNPSSGIGASDLISASLGNELAQWEVLN